MAGRGKVSRRRTREASKAAAAAASNCCGADFWLEVHGGYCFWLESYCFLVRFFSPTAGKKQMGGFLSRSLFIHRVHQFAEQILAKSLMFLITKNVYFHIFKTRP